MTAQGCLLDIDGIYYIVAENPFYNSKDGCTILEHEIYHIMGYAEHEIPKCN